MATIKVSNLHPAGTLLFSDPESFLNDLSPEELRSSGGLPTPFMPTSIVTFTILQEDLFLSIGVTIPVTR